MDRSTRKTIPILSAKSSPGVGNEVDISEYRHATIQVSAEANTTATFKFQCSLSNSAPTFSSAQTQTNHWDYVAVYDLEDPGTLIDGDTGVSFSSTSVADSCRNYILNVDYVKWFNISVTSISAGSVSANLILAND